MSPWHGASCPPVSGVHYLHDRTVFVVYWATAPPSGTRSAGVLSVLLFCNYMIVWRVTCGVSTLPVAARNWRRSALNGFNCISYQLYFYYRYIYFFYLVLCCVLCTQTLSDHSRHCTLPAPWEMVYSGARVISAVQEPDKAVCYDRHFQLKRVNRPCAICPLFQRSVPVHLSVNLLPPDVGCMPPPLFPRQLPASYFHSLAEGDAIFTVWTCVSPVLCHDGCNVIWVYAISSGNTWSAKVSPAPVLLTLGPAQSSMCY